jgi:hypothetical protein
MNDEAREKLDWASREWIARRELLGCVVHDADATCRVLWADNVDNLIEAIYDFKNFGLRKGSILARQTILYFAELPDDEKAYSIYEDRDRMKRLEVAGGCVLTPCKICESPFHETCRVVVPRASSKTSEADREDVDKILGTRDNPVLLESEEGSEGDTEDGSSGDDDDEE